MIKFLLAWLATLVVLLRKHVWRYLRRILVAIAKWVIKGAIKLLKEILNRLRVAGLWR